MDFNINPTKLVELSRYHMQFKTNEKEVVVLLQYPSHWTVLTPDNKNIECGEHHVLTYYHANITDTVFDEIFKAIDETIEFNREMEEKLALFKVKNEEMADLFKNEDLDTLKTLKFSFRRSRNKKNTNKQTVNSQDTKVSAPDVEVESSTVKNTDDTQVLAPVDEENSNNLNDISSAESEQLGVEEIVYTPPTDDEITSYDDLA